MDVPECTSLFAYSNHDHRFELTFIDWFRFSAPLLLHISEINRRILFLGYGNITPRTALGKSITILYAIIGMPLFLLYLSNIGDILAKSFKWIYAKVCLCRICPGVAKRREARNRRKMRALQRQLNEEYSDDVRN